MSIIKRMLGVAGHSHVKTPNMDKLALRELILKMPTVNFLYVFLQELILATGRYNVEIGYWDNANPYDGKIQAGDIKGYGRKL